MTLGHYSVYRFQGLTQVDPHLQRDSYPLRDQESQQSGLRQARSTIPRIQSMPLPLLDFDGSMKI